MIAVVILLFAFAIFLTFALPEFWRWIDGLADLGGAIFVTVLTGVIWTFAIAGLLKMIGG